MGSVSKGTGKMLHNCVSFVSLGQYDKNVTKDTLVRCEQCLQDIFE